MSTAGTAYHRRTTFHVPPDQAETTARAARFAARDAAYRAALGVREGQQLPTVLGVTEHSSAGRAVPQASGGRRRSGRKDDA